MYLTISCSTLFVNSKEKLICCNTQGVTLEEVQQANEVLKKTADEPSSSASSSTTSTQSNSVSSLDRGSRVTSTDWKSQDLVDSAVLRDKDSANSISDRDISNRLSSDINLRRTNSSHETDSSISSWRRSRDEANRKDVSIIFIFSSAKKYKVIKNCSF